MAFVGSPIQEKDATLKRIAKELRKNNVRPPPARRGRLPRHRPRPSPAPQVGVDIVSMGEHEANAELLDTFINTVNKEDNRSAPCSGGQVASPPPPRPDASAPARPPVPLRAAT